MTGAIRTFSISGNNKGLMCPFKPILCQEGYCRDVKYTLIGCLCVVAKVAELARLFQEAGIQE